MRVGTGERRSRRLSNTRGCMLTASQTLGTPRVGGVSSDAVTTVPNKRESPLRQSADRKGTVVGLSLPQTI